MINFDMTLRMQEGIWQWFALDPARLRTVGSVEKVCFELFRQYYPNCSQHEIRFHLLYPLLKYGVIEFYGRSGFSLSPSAILDSGLCFLFINVPGTESGLASEVPFFSHAGLKVFPKSSSVYSFVKESGVPKTYFQIADVLRTFPTLDSVIGAWRDVELMETKKCFYFSSFYDWKLEEPLKKGIYKRSPEPYAQRFLRVGSDQWKFIPNFNEHVDAFHIAIIWSQIQNGHDLGMFYSLKHRLLTINTPIFPKLLERILFANTVLTMNRILNPNHRKYPLLIDDFNILNRIFLNRIAIV